jgi:hypothetical protein
MRRIGLFGAALALLALAGCGGGGNNNAPAGTATVAPAPVVTATAPPETPTPLLPTSTPAPLPTPTSAPPTPTMDTVVHDALEGLALTLDDLPDGYVQLPAEPSSDGDGPCGHPAFERAENKLGEVEVQFQLSDEGPFVLQNLVAFPEADAADAFAYARSSIDCTEWTETPADGVPTTYRVSPLEVEPVGDESFAVRIELDIEGVGTLITDSVFIRVGNILSLVGYATVDAPDPQMLEELARSAAEKMES